uniref:RAP domain-containing protein n=1 Tax=Macrostomum lignano TaxID=282301 RepID=A0A1I8HAY8_9PLAT
SPPRRCTTSAAAAQRRPLQRSPVPQQPRASSARPTSAASIGAEYRDLTESEVAADVAVRHLGGSSCSSPDERRFWAFMAPRPYPIRKNLPSSRSSRRLARLEFVSLCGPKPENCHPRPSRLSEASATAFEPPPASPSSRPATATASASGRLAQRTVGRPLTGRPRPPAAAVGATASVSDLGDSPLSPRPPAAPAAAAATIGGDRQAAEKTPAIETGGNEHLTAPAGDPIVAELERLVSSASQTRLAPFISSDAAGEITGGEAPATAAAEVRAETEAEYGSNATEDRESTFDRRMYSYPSGAERAALVIQSGYRGYNTRRRLSRVEQLARAQGFESVKWLRRYYCELIGSAARHRPDAQELLNFLETKRRIELAFDTAVSAGPTPCRPAVTDAATLIKVFNVCDQFPSREQVEQAITDWRRRRQPQAAQLDRLSAVEIFYSLLMMTRQLSPRGGESATDSRGEQLNKQLAGAGRGQQGLLSVRGLQPGRHN